MSADAEGPPDSAPSKNVYGVIVNSRAEFVALLRNTPLQLKPARLPRAPRVGHPDFIGPVQPDALNRPGAIRFDEDGSAYIVLAKDGSDAPRDAWLKSWGIEL